jgi:hypothetical protein
MMDLNVSLIPSIYLDGMELIPSTPCPPVRIQLRIPKD